MSELDSFEDVDFLMKLNVDAFKDVMGAASAGLKSEGKKVGMLKAGAAAGQKHKRRCGCGGFSGPG